MLLTMYLKVLYHLTNIFLHLLLLLLCEYKCVIDRGRSGEESGWRGVVL